MSSIASPNASRTGDDGAGNPPPPAIREVDPNKVLDLDDQGDAVLLDVRDADEWREGHIPGSRNIPVEELDRLAQDVCTDSTIVVHSWNGARSGLAANRLAKAGYEDIRILEGGVKGWRSLGFPVSSNEGDGQAQSSSQGRSMASGGGIPAWAKVVIGAAVIVLAAFALSQATGIATGDDALAGKALAVGLAGGTVGGIVGGGIGMISVPLIVVLLGFPIHLAVGTNLFQSIFTGSSGVYQHRRKGNVKFRVALPVISGAVVGAPIGAYVSIQLPETILLSIFSLVLLGLAGFLARDLLKPSENREKTGTDLSEKLANGERSGPIGKVSEKVIGEKATDAVRDVVATPIEGEHQGTRFTVDRVTPVLIGVGVGFIAGLLGIGGGSILVPFMTTLLGLPAHLAVGTGLVVVTGNAAAGSVTHLLHQNVNLLAAFFLAVGGITGTAVGTRLSEAMSGKAIQALLLVVVLGVAWRMAPIGSIF